MSPGTDYLCRPGKEIHEVRDARDLIQQHSPTIITALSQISIFQSARRLSRNNSRFSHFAPLAAELARVAN